MAHSSRIQLLAIAAATALTLAACGGGGDDSSSSGGAGGAGGTGSPSGGSTGGATLDCASVGTPGNISSDPPSGGLSQEAKCAIVNKHNEARAEVGVTQELKWSTTLETFAQNFINGCPGGHNPAAQNLYGENYAAGSVGGYSVTDFVTAWYGEKPSYHGEAINNSNYHTFGHYTQMVWRNTTEIGCGYKVCGGMVQMVCNYNPPGNVLGQKPY